MRFYDVPQRELTEAQLIEIAHWVVIDDYGSIEWRVCGPDCTHFPPKLLRLPCNPDDWRGVTGSEGK